MGNGHLACQELPHPLPPRGPSAGELGLLQSPPGGADVRVCGSLALGQFQLDLVETVVDVACGPAIVFWRLSNRSVFVPNAAITWSVCTSTILCNIAIPSGKSRDCV